jgi:hypothetical protein
MRTRAVDRVAWRNGAASGECGGDRRSGWRFAVSIADTDHLANSIVLARCC